MFENDEISITLIAFFRYFRNHDDVIKWKLFPRYWPFVREFLAQRPVTRSFGVFFDVHSNKRLSKQWWGWWFETPSCPLWRHRNVSIFVTYIPTHIKHDYAMTWAPWRLKSLATWELLQQSIWDHCKKNCKAALLNFYDGNPQVASSFTKASNSGSVYNLNAKPADAALHLKNLKNCIHPLQFEYT